MSAHHRFETIGELIEYADRAPDGYAHTSAYACEVSFAEARDLATHGWDANRAEIDAVVGNLKATVSETMDIGFIDVFDVAGHTVDIGRYVMGEPECMVQSLLTPTPRHGRVSRILVDSSYLGSVSERSVFARGVALIAIVELMRLAGQNCEIWCEASSNAGSGTRSKKHHTVLVKIKDAADSLDVDSVAFMIGHPGFFRRLVWGCRDVDSIPGWRHEEGYGSSIEPTMAEDIDADVVLAKPNNYTSYDATWIIEQLKTLGILEKEG